MANEILNQELEKRSKTSIRGEKILKLITVKELGVQRMKIPRMRTKHEDALSAGKDASANRVWADAVKMARGVGFVSCRHCGEWTHSAKSKCEHCDAVVLTF